jgi:hypothetical protein
MSDSRFSVIPEVRLAANAAAAGIRVPFVRPALPSIEVLRPAYEEIVASGQLTKGKFVERLQSGSVCGMRWP